MSTRYRRGIFVLVVVLVVGGAAALGAGAAVLKNTATGETITGTLTDQSINGLRVFVVAGSERKKFLNMDEWRVVEADAGAAASAKSPEPAATAAAESVSSSSVLYGELPMAGVIGKDVTADEVRFALKQAAGFAAIKHVVVKIKSPGGQAAVAKEIADLIKSYDGRFEFHAIVEEAAGAGVEIALACQTIHMAEGSTLGGAAAEPEKAATVEAKSDVAAKSDSTAKAEVAPPANLGADVAAIAEARGRSGMLAKALATGEGKVYAWKDEAGKVQIADQAPAGVPAGRMIVVSEAKTALVLTQAQAVALGLAKPLGGGGSAMLGADLGITGWKLAGCNLAATMSQARQRAAEKETARGALEKRKVENTEKRKMVVAVITEKQQEADKNDPKGGTYTYSKLTQVARAGNEAEPDLDMKSVNEWRSRTDKCLDCWNKVLLGVKTMVPLEKEADGFGLERMMDDKKLSDLFVQAQSEIKRLTTQRNISQLPK